MCQSRASSPLVDLRAESIRFLHVENSVRRVHKSKVGFKEGSTEW